MRAVVRLLLLVWATVSAVSFVGLVCVFPDYSLDRACSEALRNLPSQASIVLVSLVYDFLFGWHLRNSVVVWDISASSTANCGNQTNPLPTVDQRWLILPGYTQPFCRHKAAHRETETGVAEPAATAPHCPKREQRNRGPDGPPTTRETTEVMQSQW
jgi:hypothetical protein